VTCRKKKTGYICPIHLRLKDGTATCARKNKKKNNNTEWASTKPPTDNKRDKKTHHYVIPAILGSLQIPPSGCQ
jgi:hypothetical protein